MLQKDWENSKASKAATLQHSNSSNTSGLLTKLSIHLSLSCASPAAERGSASETAFKKLARLEKRRVILEAVCSYKGAFGSVYLHTLRQLDHHRGTVIRLCLKVPLEFLCQMSLELLSLFPQSLIHSRAASAEQHLKQRAEARESSDMAPAGHLLPTETPGSTRREPG